MFMDLSFKVISYLVPTSSLAIYIHTNGPQ